MSKSSKIYQNKLVQSRRALKKLDRIPKYQALKRLCDCLCELGHIFSALQVGFQKAFSYSPIKHRLWKWTRLELYCHIIPFPYFNKPFRMNTPKMMLSFALNPITNTLEFVTVPEIDFKQTERPRLTKPKQKICEHHKREEGDIILERTADHQESTQARRRRKVDDGHDLDRRLSSLIRSVHNGSPCLQPQIGQILEIGNKTPPELLVMMEYTQKLSYLRSKCQASPCHTKKLSVQIDRIIQWALREQEEYCLQLCRMFLPNASK